ncbi:nuclear transport factor 2 family protein [Streptococcus sp. H31]|uniref:nuclear transport factor 2 family protein n=1 Tax=Streptococcus huangxiaojuni TaxID=3237239 RepID=UPI0034A18FB2
MNTEILLAKLELKELVDTFSNLADIKDTKTQVQLFTEDAVVTSHNGNQTFKQEGHEAIESAFANFLAPFDTVYHLNGQQVVTIDEDKATGTAYCHVVLIGPNQEEKRIQTTQGVRYEDEYVKVGGQWKIAKRTSYFMYTDSKEV